MACCQLASASQPVKMKTHQHRVKSNGSRPQWFITAGGGVAFPSFGHTQLAVANNSGFPAPFNQDAYTVHQNPQPLATLGLGRRWEAHHRGLSSYSLGVYYQHFFATNMGNQITQYSAPAFTNYQYNWNLSSDVLFLEGKLNLPRYGRLSPYLTGGLGCAFNTSGGYSESALPGLTDTRVSASYKSKMMLQLAYNVGAGLDFQLTKTVFASAEYQFQDLGTSSLGHGSGTWASESLNLGQIRNNAMLIKLTYLIDTLTR